MNTLRITSLVTLFLFSAHALAEGESVDETKAAASDGFVSINVVRGEVKIRGWDRDAVRVVGTLDEQTKQFIFNVRDNETEIRVKLESSAGGWFDDYSSDLTVHVPEASQIEFTGVSTDLDVRNVNNSLEVGGVSGDLYVEGELTRIDVQTVSGDIELRDTPARLDISSVSGDVEVFEASGEARYSTVSGDITIEDSGDDMRVESVSGDIEVDSGTVTRLDGHSVSGDINISVDPADDASIEFDSMSGTMRIRLGGDVNATFDVETGSGSIRNRISDDKPKVSKYMSDEVLRFTLGDGDGQVILTTRSGDISISGR